MLKMYITAKVTLYIYIPRSLADVTRSMVRIAGGTDFSKTCNHFDTVWTDIVASVNESGL